MKFGRLVKTLSDPFVIVSTSKTSVYLPVDKCVSHQYSIRFGCGCLKWPVVGCLEVDDSSTTHAATDIVRPAGTGVLGGVSSHMCWGVPSGSGVLEWIGTDQCKGSSQEKGMGRVGGKVRGQ